MGRMRQRLAAVLVVAAALAALPLLYKVSSRHHANAAAVARTAHAAILERERGEEANGGPDAEAYSDRAYPATDVSIEEVRGAIAANANVAAHGSRLNSKWESLGPSTLNVDRLATQSFIKATQWSGRVTALTVSPTCTTTTGCTLYVGAAGGGVWRTPNALAPNPSWKHISDDIPTNAIGSTAVAPNDASAQTLYAGTGEGNNSGDSEAGLGLYKSTDGGAHWSVVPGSRAVANNRSITWVAVQKG